MQHRTISVFDLSFSLTDALSILSTFPVSSSSRSASVDFPWSMCAMMPKFRMRSSPIRSSPLAPCAARSWTVGSAGSLGGITKEELAAVGGSRRRTVDKRPFAR